MNSNGNRSKCWFGYATAKKFCDKGIITYVNGRNREKTEAACKELDEKARPFILDLNNRNDIPKAISKLAEEAGKINILVNNAGINMKKRFLEVTDEDFKSILQTPSDVADAVFYFATSESKYTTATLLPVDGGNSIGF